MYHDGSPAVRQTSLRPILRPGAPWYANLLTTSAGGMLLGAALITIWMALVLAVGLLVAPIGVVGVLGLGGIGIAAASRASARDIVTGPGWRFQRRPISGQAFQLIEDIDSRFAYAESNVRKLPTGISWPEVAEDVRALLWEAAEHGALVTSLDTEIHEMRYAEPGTPQAALKHSIEEQREQRWQIMRGIQWEAETLARTAGNAVAAAHVALAKTGSLAALEQVTPSRRAMVAAGALAEARARLQLLADVWSELDETGMIAAERLDGDRRKELEN